MPDIYHIKDGYRANLVQGTLDKSDGAIYWTAARRRSAEQFQYYVYLFAQRELRRRPGVAVLDVGCGFPWKFAKLIAPWAGAAQLVDQPSTAVLARELCASVPFVGVDLETVDTTLPRCFDLIICADVIEHLVDPDPCLRFIGRHLAAGGVAVFSTPERDRLRGFHCLGSPKPEHVREWNAAEFRAFLTSRGFVVETQKLLPQRRLPALEFLAFRILGPGVLTRRWGSCQLVAARYSGGTRAHEQPPGPGVEGRRSPV